MDRVRSWLQRPSPLQRVAFAPVSYSPDAMSVPVLLIAFYPASNGRITRSVTGDVDGDVATIRGHVTETTRRLIDALELGSTYHGYKRPDAAACLRYEVAGSIEFLEPMPTTAKAGHAVPMTDYRAILERMDIEAWVERGVKEVWIWGYHGGVLDLWESNLAGPFGDISNSDRDPADLPVFGRTYTVYHYNYGRGTSEACENHMHQVEALLRHVDEDLFWRRFVGGVGEGRCGWSHYPPNGARDYDWANPKRVATDIEDWSPEGGPKTTLNADRWGGDSLTWFIYWMQNLPGEANGLTYRGRPLANWWRFVGEWDEMMASGCGLLE
jgi:hypothetical protein